MKNFAEYYRKLLEELGMNPNEFAVEVGFHNTKSYNFMKGESEPSYKTIQQMLARFPHVNANFLLKGQFPVLHTSGAEIVGPTYQDLGQTLSVLEPTTAYNGEVGKLRYALMDESLACKNPIVVRVSDSSMTPRYGVGMRLLACPVEAQEWEYLHSALVLVLYRSVLMLRRVKENELLSRGYLTLYADSDSAGYVLVKREDLRSIWRIIDIIGAGNDL